MTFWLVLLLAGGSAPLHVGNYTSLAACETAAREAALFNPGPGARVPHNFICVQANESGTKPPN